MQHQKRMHQVQSYAMHDGLDDIACLLTTDTGDTGSSPHMTR